MTIAPATRLMLDASFGSVARWRAELTAIARASHGGSDWVRLVFRPQDGRLVHQWGADATQASAGGVPILDVDVSACADDQDPGAGARAHVDALIGNIDWAAVHGRYQQAVHAASDARGASPDEIGNALVLDVRRSGVFEQARALIPGARWYDPSAVSTWLADLQTDRDVVVYCVHGHEVSRVTALRLQASGLKARFLRGGIEGWQSSGRPVVGTS